MSRSTFNQMWHAFAHKMDLESEWVTLQQISILAGIRPVEYDCCVNSCVAYTEKYHDYLRCPIFHYLPLIPHLQAFFESTRMIEELSYRHHYIPSDDCIHDIFDSGHYRTLLEEKVEIDGEKLPYTYFSGEDDIALSICTDGHCVFWRHRNGLSAMPILLQIYNLPPQIRTHLTNLIRVSIIPDHPSDMA